MNPYSNPRAWLLSAFLALGASLAAWAGDEPEVAASFAVATIAALLLTGITGKRRRADGAEQFRTAAAALQQLLNDPKRRRKPVECWTTAQNLVAAAGVHASAVAVEELGEMSRNITALLEQTWTDRKTRSKLNLGVVGLMLGTSTHLANMPSNDGQVALARQLEEKLWVDRGPNEELADYVARMRQAVPANGAKNRFDAPVFKRLVRDQS